MGDRSKKTDGDNKPKRQCWGILFLDFLILMMDLLRVVSVIALVIVVVPLVFAGICAVILFLWGRKMSPWLSYCRGGLYRMYFFVYYPVRIVFIGVVAHEIARRVIYKNGRQPEVRMIRQACVGIASISVLYLIPATLGGCSRFESEFMRQKEAWPEVHQAELQRFLDYAFPGEPISVFVDTLCRNYNWKWILMVIPTLMSLAFSLYMTRGELFPWW